MSDEPYHAHIINTATGLDPKSAHYLVLLTAFARFAAGCKTPKEYRVDVAAAFERHLKPLEERNNPPDYSIDDAISACMAVAPAMAKQDEEDPAKEQQEQQ